MHAAAAYLQQARILPERKALVSVDCAGLRRASSAVCGPVCGFLHHAFATRRR